MEIPVKQSAEDNSSLEFARSYHPKENLSRYNWVITYAEGKVSLMVKSLEALDSKTETLMRYLGGVAVGLVALSSLVFKDHFDLAWLFLPSVVFLISGAMKAGASAAPDDFYAPPAILRAFQYADYHGDSAAVRFYACWTALEHKLKEAMGIKSQCYHSALRCLWAAIWWAVLVATVISWAGLEKIRNFF